MKRTTFTLDDDLHYRLIREAERSGQTVSELVRDALADKLSNGKVPSFIGLGPKDRGGPTDIAQNLDYYLEKDLTKHLELDFEE